MLKSVRKYIRVTDDFDYTTKGRGWGAWPYSSRVKKDGGMAAGGDSSAMATTFALNLLHFVASECVCVCVCLP